MCGTAVAGGQEPAPKQRPVAAGDGATLASTPASGVTEVSSSMGRWLGVAGAVGVLIVLLLVVLPAFDSPPGSPAASSASPAGPAPAASPLGNPSSVDLSSMTPREAADSLFNRVMRSVSAGDSVGARAFAPMAISAYELVAEKNADLHYHIAVLQIVNDDGGSARQTADEILAENPNHLFGLYAAAQAELMLGNRDAALGFYSSFIDNYDAEIAAGRTEYAEHAAALPAMREDAERIIASSR